MSTRTILSATLRWHVRKARRLFELLAQRLASPSRAPARSGVRWG
jgi:hypothetical protein